MNSVNRYFEGFLVGGTIGFVVGLLTAPKPGSELRRELASRSDDLYRQANTQLSDLKGRSQQYIHELQDRSYELAHTVQDMRGRLNENVHDITEQGRALRDRVIGRAQEIKHEAGDLMQTAQERGRELVEQGKDLVEQGKDVVRSRRYATSKYAPESEEYPTTGGTTYPGSTYGSETSFGSGNKGTLGS